MKIDKRVMALLKANCITFGWDINKAICAAFKNDMFTPGDDVSAPREWERLLDKLIEEENAEGEK